MNFILTTLFIVINCKHGYSSISNPYRADGDITKIIPEYSDVKTFKIYHNMTPEHNPNVDKLKSTLESCDINAHLKWTSVVGSSVYSTPVIFPSGDDDKKQIFLNTFYQYVEVLGYDGFKPWGFPLGFDGSSFQTSPILYDIDGDGVNDVGAVDKDANLYWIRLGEFGQYLEDFHVQVPKLKVRKDWADGMDPSFLDSYVLTSMFDNRYDPKRTEQAVKQDVLQVLVKQDTYPEQNNAAGHAVGEDEPDSQHTRRLEVLPKGNKKRDNTVAASPWQGRRLLQAEEGANVPLDDVPLEKQAENMAALDEVQREKDLVTAHEKELEEKRTASGEANAAKDDDYVAGDPGYYMPPHWDDPDTPENGGDPSEWVDDYTPGQFHGRHYMGRAYMGDDMMFNGYGGFGGIYNDSNYVYVDPHVLANPTLADVNNDGNVEIIIPVSYYFDKTEYAGRKLDFVPANYIAGGIACWNIQEEEWSWLVHLDLTTDKTKFKALIHSAPTVADLDGDGRSEVIVGTSLGLLYVLDGNTGFSRRYFPMQFHEIQAQVVVADVRGGPDLEIIVGDLGGNLVCVNIDGDVLWDARLSGRIYQAPTVGDIDGDGTLDVVVAVAAIDGYHIYAVRGDTGQILSGYPFALPAGGEVSAPIVLVDLHDYSDTTHSRLSPATYTDPYAPSWTIDSFGHSSVPVPSSASVPPPSTDSGNKPADAAASEHLEEPHGGNLDDWVLADVEHIEETEGKGSGRRLTELRKAADTISDMEAAPAAGAKVGETEAQREKRRFSKRRDQILREWYGEQKKKDPTVRRGLHMIIPSFDGHLYIVNGLHTCAERIDIGEHIFSTPLVDDVTGNGMLDIVVGTVNGHVHLLETQIPHHPLNAWSSFPKHRGNVFTHGQAGLSIPLREKKLLRYMDVKGGEFIPITFDIWDTRVHVKDSSAPTSYTVVFTRGTNRMDPMLKKTFTKPGRYTVQLPVAPPETMHLVIGMLNEHGQYFEDSVHISVSTRFYIWMKYLILFPLFLLTIPLLMMRSSTDGV